MKNGPAELPRLGPFPPSLPQLSGPPTSPHFLHRLLHTLEKEVIVNVLEGIAREPDEREDTDGIFSHELDIKHTCSRQAGDHIVFCNGLTGTPAVSRVCLKEAGRHECAENPQ